MNRVRPQDLFRLFLRIGAFTFGGGMAMIPLIRQELVVRHALLDDESFAESLALAQCAPGPLAGNLSVLLGYRLAGWEGAALSLLGVALPAFVVITVIAANYAAWRNQTWAAQAFAGIRPAVVVLIASAAIRVGRAALTDRYALTIFALAGLALLILRLHPLLVVFAAAGAAIARLRWQTGRSGEEVCGSPDGSAG